MPKTKTGVFSGKTPVLAIFGVIFIPIWENFSNYGSFIDLIIQAPLHFLIPRKPACR